MGADTLLSVVDYYIHVVIYAVICYSFFKHNTKKSDLQSLEVLSDTA